MEEKEGWNAFCRLAENRNRVGCLVAQNVHVGNNNVTLSAVWQFDICFVEMTSYSLRVHTHAVHAETSSVCVSPSVFHAKWCSRLRPQAIKISQCHAPTTQSLTHSLTHTYMYRRRQTSSFCINLLATKGNFPGSPAQSDCPEAGCCGRLESTCCLQEWTCNNILTLHDSIYRNTDMFSSWHVTTNCSLEIHLE